MSKRFLKGLLHVYLLGKRHAQPWGLPLVLRCLTRHPFELAATCDYDCCLGKHCFWWSLHLHSALVNWWHWTLGLPSFLFYLTRFACLPIWHSYSDFLSGLWALLLCYSLSKVPLPVSLAVHSTRVMAAFMAFLDKIPLKEICGAATWKTATTFIRHYALEHELSKWGRLAEWC